MSSVLLNFFYNNAKSGTFLLYQFAWNDEEPNPIQLRGTVKGGAQAALGSKLKGGNKLSLTLIVNIVSLGKYE